MCDSNSSSGILIGEPPISSAPPLILLQSEEDSVNPGSSCGTAITSEERAGVSSGVSISGPTLECNEQPPSSHAWCTTATSSNALPPDTWTLDQVLSEDKNPFSDLTEEHLNRLEDVLASDEVRSFLQQTTLSEFDSQLVPDSVGLTSAASDSVRNNTSSLPPADIGQLSEDTLKFDLFDNPAPEADLNIDQALVQHLMQDNIREHDLVAMAAAFSDHAYAMSNVSADSAIFSPRKSARIKQRMDDGKCAFESDSDFEYYFTPRRTTKKDQSDVSDVDKASSSPASCPIESASAPTSSSKPKQPKRRSTRIVDMENREKAEKIIQENRRQEQEAKAALLKQQEEESKKTDVTQQPDQTSPATENKTKQTKVRLFFLFLR